jgi:hypothetical protein
MRVESDGTAGAWTLAGFAMGILTGWIFHRSPELWRVVGSQELAAWVQALGTIIAIGIAIAVPTKIELTRQKRKNHDDQRRAVALGVLIADDVIWLATMAGHIAETAPDKDLLGNVRLPDGRRAWVEEIIKLPNEIREIEQQLHATGPASIALLQAVLRIKMLPSIMNSARDIDRGRGKPDPNFSRDSIRHGLRGISDALDYYSKWLQHSLWKDPPL